MRYECVFFIIYGRLEKCHKLNMLLNLKVNDSLPLIVSSLHATCLSTKIITALGDPSPKNVSITIMNTGVIITVVRSGVMDMYTS